MLGCEVKSTLTELIQDELIPSVLEYDIDGEYYHRYLTPEDEACNWGDWEPFANTRWESRDVRHRRMSTRVRKPVDYSNTKRRPSNRAPQHDEAMSADGEKSTLSDTVTGYNNKARNTSQNPPREAAPYLGKPSRKDYAEYA